MVHFIRLLCPEEGHSSTVGLGSSAQRGLCWLPSKVLPRNRGVQSLEVSLVLLRALSIPLCCWGAGASESSPALSLSFKE